jgi:tetratricopeptide (TPR) repeat protein
MTRLAPMLLLAGLSLLPAAQADDDDSSTPALTGQDYLSQCSDDIDADDDASAISSCSDALQAGGLDADQTFMAYLYRGMAHHQKGEDEAAITDISESFAAAPDHKDTDFAHFERGAAYLSDKQYAKALGDFDAAVQLKPTEPNYYSMRGSAYFDLERDAEAIADQTKAIELDPKSTDAYSERAAAHLMHDDYAAAVQDATQVLQLSPDDSSARTVMGEGYYFQGQYAKALEQFDAGLSKFPTDDYAMVWQFLASQRAGQDRSKPLAAQLDAMKARGWTYLLGQLYLGKASKDMVLGAAMTATSDPEVQKQVLCQAKSFLGAYYQNAGHAGTAAPLLKDALSLCEKNSIGRILAQQSLAARKKQGAR